MRDKTIVRDPERFGLIRKIWDLLLQGTIPSRIMEIANTEWGFRTTRYKRMGGKPLRTSTLYNLFNNPFYYGLIEWNGGSYAGKHEPMITEAEYWQAQEILGRKGRPRPKRHAFPFTGMIRCGECGSMITAEEKDNRYGIHYAYYRCSKKKRNTRCLQKYINAKDLDAQISEYLDKIYVPESLLRLAFDYLNDEEKDEIGKYEEIRITLEKAQAKGQKKLDNLNQMRLNDLIDDAEYLKEKRQLVQERIKLESSLADRKRNGEQTHKQTEKTFLFANQAKDGFQNGTLEDKKSILHEIGSNFLLRGKKLLIQAEKPFCIIEEGLRTIGSGNVPLEPPQNILPKLNFNHSFAAIQHWLAVVEDVRTFYRNKK
jgi:hypothetical protein